MKTFYALLIAALFTTAACKKDKDAAKTEPAKTEPAAKTADPAKTEPAPTPEPAKTEPAKTEPAPAAGAVTVDAVGAQALALAEKMGKVADDAGDSCEKLGTGLKGLTEDAKTIAKHEKELEKTPEAKKEFAAKYEKPAVEKMGASMKKIEKCMENADVKAFIEAISAE